MNKRLAEFIGTFALVFFGCGTAVVGGMGSGPTAVNLPGIASAFGFAIVATAYGVGPISGCHVNPAVSFGVFVAGRMSANEMIGYKIAQVLGAIVGAAVLYLILSSKAQGWTGGLGQNGWGAGYLGEYNVVSAFVFEVVGTFLFLVCILGVTHPFAPSRSHRREPRACGRAVAFMTPRPGWKTFVERWRTASIKARGWYKAMDAEPVADGLRLIRRGQAPRRVRPV